MQVFHTAGVPPSRGRSILASASSIQNSRRPLRKIVAANNNSTRRELDHTLTEDVSDVAFSSMNHARTGCRILATKRHKSAKNHQSLSQLCAFVAEDFSANQVVAPLTNHKLLFRLRNRPQPVRGKG